MVHENSQHCVPKAHSLQFSSAAQELQKQFQMTKYTTFSAFKFPKTTLKLTAHQAELDGS
jgi:hypothetical protein